MWKITRDFLNEKWNNEGGEYNSVSRVGISGHADPPKIRFRLYDDDGECYYQGWLHDDDECLNQSDALDWGTYDSGCTIIKVKRGRKWVQEIG